MDARNFENIHKAITRLISAKPTPEQFHKVLKTVAAENGLNYVDS